ICHPAVIVARAAPAEATAVAAICTRTSRRARQLPSSKGSHQRRCSPTDLRKAPVLKEAMPAIVDQTAHVTHATVDDRIWFKPFKVAMDDVVCCVY
ncbi:Hypothetical predicted protein, partial [Olea europaea subsp. europaea]